MTRTRYEIIKEGFEVRKDIEAEDIFDAFLEEGVKNGSYEVIGYADTLEEARKISKESNFVKSHLPENILKAYKII